MAQRGSSQKRVMKDKLFHGYATAKCCFCRRTLSKSTATIEHVTPLAHGGGWRLENLRVSCFDCNNARGVQPFEEFRKKKRDAIAAKVAKSQQQMKENQ
jgi:5-methylcytosine-specific restriction endonuclease McrA